MTYVNPVYQKVKKHKKFRTEKDLWKYFEKRCYKATHSEKPKKLFPLVITPRIAYDPNDPESWTEYGFIKESEQWNEQDIQEWKKEEWIRICSPYDCTGKPCTMWISTHKNPCGLVSFIHKKALDL